MLWALLVPDVPTAWASKDKTFSFGVFVWRLELYVRTVVFVFSFVVLLRVCLARGDKRSLVSATS